jgi:hypothetical protein
VTRYLQRATRSTHDVGVIAKLQDSHLVVHATKRAFSSDLLLLHHLSHTQQLV